MIRTKETIAEEKLKAAKDKLDKLGKRRDNYNKLLLTAKENQLAVHKEFKDAQQEYCDLLPDVHKGKYYKHVSEEGKYKTVTLYAIGERTTVFGGDWTYDSRYYRIEYSGGNISDICYYDSMSFNSGDADSINYNEMSKEEADEFIAETLNALKDKWLNG